MSRYSLRCAALFGALVMLVAAVVSTAGPLNPPAGPVAPTPGPEPRIAINSTNTPGDADSTFRIAQPGSYYLTGNVSGQNARIGIEIATGGVTLDLWASGSPVSPGRWRGSASARPAPRTSRSSTGP
jgi:hypothetical protein